MSKKNKQQVPKVRFTGFSDSWLQGKLRDGVFRLIGGVSISPSDYFEEGCPTVPKGAVNVSGVADLSGIKYVSESFFQNNNKAVVSEGDLITCLRDLVPSGPNLARIVKIPVSKQEYKYLMPQGVYALKLRNNLIYSFLVNFSNTDGFRNIVFREKNGTTQVHIRNDDFLDIKIIYPSTNEQTQIGNFFQQLDKLIELQTRAVESAETYKKAMLQKMFPQKGEKVPRVRFEGFSGDWATRTIGSLSEKTIGGGTPSTSILEYWSGDIPWIQSSDILIDNVLNISPTKTITQNAIQNSAARLIPKNSLAIVTRVGVGKLCLLPYEYATSQDFLSLVHLNINEIYATYCLYRFLCEEKNKVQGTSIKGITKADLLSQKVLVPISCDEQTQIGNFFQKLDHNIEAEKKKLEQYQMMKRAMLQRMFV